MWDLAAAQAQMEAISAALMPVDIGPSGRVQVPSVEVQETVDHIIVTAFLPGVEPQAVQVRATAQAVTFLGQRRSGYHSPLAYGMGVNYFQQTVPLPAPVQDHHLQVTYQQGAIVVTLPKAKRPWLSWLDRLRDRDGQRPSLGQIWQRQCQRWGQGWQRTKTWLGHRLQVWSERLLSER